MKNLLRFRAKALVLTAIFLIGIVGMLSAQKIAIIDAGSSGSRLYVYELKNGTLTPLESDIKSGIKLSELVTDDTQVATFITSMVSQYQKTDDEVISLYILATAGMRKVDKDKADLLYSKISTASIPAEYKLEKTMTISGRYEGFCAWLAANYENGKISIDTSGDKLKYTSNPTYGILEIGGASMQIAFQKDESDDDYIQRDGLGKIYSKSYLGGGVDEIYTTYGEPALPSVPNYSETISRLPNVSNQLFYGLGKPIDIVKTAYCQYGTLEKYLGTLGTDSEKNFHPKSNEVYVEWLIGQLGITMDKIFSKPYVSWTEGAALDILLYGEKEGEIPELYKNN